jgi:tetratricopeptide (TPR) repeat protein
MNAGTLIAGRFEIVGHAGRGGMASVERAIDRETGDFVAVKVLHVSVADAGERFRREADALARMKHPGIVGYIAHGETPDGRAFLAMSWIDGETVGARVRRVGKLDPRDVMDLGAHVADALAASHAVGIVHRDVKPANLLLASEGFDRPVLVDFGIARDEGAAELTQEGLLIGTPGYISPEQARGVLRIDARADQFSLGCVLHACLTGRAPFRGEDLVGVLAKILFQDTPRVRAERPDVPVAVDELLAKAMAKEPDERFADMATMARALRKAHARLGGASDSLSAPSLGSMPTPTTTSGISAREARLSAMVMVGRATTPSDQPLDDAILIGQRFGGDVERLANGGLALRFIEAAGATERALAAARCALSLRQHLPTMPISVATVRGSGGDDDVVKAIDRAAMLVRDAPRSARTGSQPIRIDETTAGLLDARFDVRTGESGLELVAESGPGDESRKLLGVAVPFLGRDRELLTLDATLEEVEVERIARAVIVTAEAGIGKSRLRREWMHRIRERGDDVTIWTARADPLDSRAPHGLLGQAVRRALGVADDEPQATKQARLREHLTRVLDEESVARIFPFAAEIIGAPLLDAVALTDPRLAAARGDRALMAEQIRRAFEEWIIAECRRPLVVIFDDAHWSDAATLRLLDAALKAAADHPLLVAVFARPSLRPAHPALFVERRVQELRLEGLTRRSAERLARSILGPDASKEVLDRIVTLANGNAFFLEELMRAVADGKGGELPDSVLSVVEARLEALEPDARRVLRAASVFGQFFWPSGVAAILGDTDEQAAEAWIATLSQREIVAPRAQSRFGDEPELTFRHVLVRDTAYSMLTPDDRSLAHRAAAAWLEARGEGEAAVLAAHLEAGGDTGRASAHYLRAATQMQGSGELAASRDLVARGLACGPSGETRAELLLVDSDVSRWLGDLDRSARTAEEVMLFADAGSEAHVRALAIALVAHLKLGHTERHRELLAVALRFLEHADPTPTTCRLASGAGVGAIFFGDIKTAHAVGAIVARFVEAPDLDAATRATLHVFRAFLSDATGDLEAQIRHFDAAATYFEQVGDERNALLHRTNAAFARTLVGDYDEAARRLFDVLEAASRHGLKFVVDTAHADLGGTLERLLRFEEAREHAELAVSGFRLEGDQRMEGASRAYLAIALHRLGRTSEGFDEILAAVALARNARQILPSILAMLANMEIDAGRGDDALAHAEEAGLALSETRSDGAHEIQVRVAHARALAAVGRADDARAALREAHARLRTRLELIQTPHLRACFEQVEENKTVLKWAAGVTK